MYSLLSEEFVNILQEIPGDRHSVEKTVAIFQKHAPKIAKHYGVLFVYADVTEPSLQNPMRQESRRIPLYDTPGVLVSNNKNISFAMGNGGNVEIVMGIERDAQWTAELERDCTAFARLIYLLIGRTRAMNALDYMTYTDQLTGIANDTQINRYMGQIFARGEFAQYCINFLNIKNMKLLNERYDERGGSQILVQFAKRMQAFTGEDGCVARVGGDNFFLFIKAEKEKAALKFIREMQVELALPDGRKLDVKVDSRVGYYYIQPGDNPGDAKSNSSIAARVAKSGNNPDVVEYNPIMKKEMLWMKQLEDNIPGAIANQEFVVYYQPKADISNPKEYKLCGAEALVRWCKEGKMIPPNDFIPLLEKNGMVIFVDFYVLEHVCQDMKKWEAEGKKLVRISSNFSRRHLKYPDFADRVEYIIKKYNIDPQYLEIEITESYDVEDMEALTVFEKRMHKLGIRLSVDDFGSGFSSLKMVKNIVSDTIKLDKSIIDGVGGENEQDKIIVSHIIQMIRKLGKEVIAEGVETVEQADFLRENDCDMIQGFLYGKPMPRDEFEQIM